MKKIQEDHKEIASGKKKDDEGYMARLELDSIERSIKNLRKVIKSSDTQLPAWVQSKITRAADYIDSATEYLQGDQKLDEEISGKIDPEKYKELRIKERQQRKAAELSQHPSTNPNVAATARKKAGVQLPPIQKEEKSLVDQILSEMGCGCNKTKKGKKCPQHGYKDCSALHEEKDPKGPVQPYKTPEEIAKKHGVSLELIKKQLKMGIKVEGEHTSDPTAARITALQHLGEVPDYYSKLKKVEAQNESKIVRDMFGNVSYEFVDLIAADPILEGKKKKSDPCWDGYKLKKGAKKYEKGSCEPIEEATLPSQNGHLMSVTVMWRGKYYATQMFFPQVKMPNRREVTDAVNKVYPDSKVVTFGICNAQPGMPIIQLPKSKNYLMNNGTIGEELEEDWQKVNRQDKTDGLSQAAVNAYRRENPGSKLQTAVTEKKPKGKRKKRRSAFCRRMKGMREKLTSKKTARDPDSRINKALRRWRCK